MAKMTLEEAQAAAAAMNERFQQIQQQQQQLQQEAVELQREYDRTDGIIRYLTPDPTDEYAGREMIEGDGALLASADGAAG